MSNPFLKFRKMSLKIYKIKYFYMKKAKRPVLIDFNTNNKLKATKFKELFIH